MKEEMIDLGDADDVIEEQGDGIEESESSAIIMWGGRHERRKTT